MKKLLVFSALAAVGLTAMSTTANAFDTNACMACHGIDIPKVGPSMQSMVKAYGNEKALAKAFEGGFAVADRKIASADATWKAKAPIMSVQYNLKIKGQGKAAAHAVFETVKSNAYGDY
jgi:cytochrome c551/c552